MTMTNERKDIMSNTDADIQVGAILADRDTRRKGRMVKVIWVDQDHITVETTQDHINAKTTAVGNQTDIKKSRLNKGYRLVGYNEPIETLDASKFTSGSFTIDGLGGMSIVSVKETEKSDDSEGLYDARDSGPGGGISFGDPNEILCGTQKFISEGDDDIVDDEMSLDSALNSAGYFWLPSLDVLQAQVDGLLHQLAKKDIVALVHGIIKQNALME